MTVLCLTEEQKDALVYRYTEQGVSQAQLAQDYWVSERTIYRVLLERGVLTPRSELTVLNDQNVQEYLNRCTKDQLARFFYVSGLVKLGEIVQRVRSNKPNPSNDETSPTQSAQHS